MIRQDCMSERWSGMRKKINKDIVYIAERRINYLFNLAVDNRSEIALCNRYISMAEAIARRMDITLPRDIKRKYCKRCKTLYSVNAHIRLRHRILTVRCGNCGDIRRIPY